VTVLVGSSYADAMSSFVDLPPRKAAISNNQLYRAVIVDVPLYWSGSA